MGHKAKYCDSYRYYWGPGQEGCPVLKTCHKPLVVSKLDGVTLHCKDDGILNTSQYVLPFQDQNFKDKDTYPKTTTAFIEWIKRLLVKKIIWSYFKLDKTTGDGHCFIYAVVKSMASQRVGCRLVNKETLLQDIAKETRGYICKY